MSLELAALYRATMPPEVRARERGLRAELQDREAELRTVSEQLARLQQQAEAQVGQVHVGHLRG